MFTNIVDLHVHAAPSILPRRYTDPELLAAARAIGLSTVALKAHEGSTAERARLAGPGAVGGIVLNSPVGGANPDAVAVAAQLGGRVVWMPTVSAPAHIASQDAALSVHRQTTFRAVPVCDAGRLRGEWYPVLEVVAAHDMVLASGHVAMPEALALFQAARALGVRRFLLNHPSFPFQGWSDELAPAFRGLGAVIEIGVLADHLAGDGPRPSATFLGCYPADLLAFGSDLGHTAFPEYAAGIRAWLAGMVALAGERQLEKIMTTNGRELLGL